MTRFQQERQRKENQITNYEVGRFRGYQKERKRMENRINKSN